MTLRVPLQVVLERLLMQLVAIQQVLHAANGGHGQVFRLADHMLSPSPRFPRRAMGNGAANGFTASANGVGNGFAHMD